MVEIHPIPLDTSGKVYDKNFKPNSENGGLLGIFRNHSIRGKIWNLSILTIHSQTGEVYLADERGQIYFFNFSTNSYSSLRLASRPILSMDFVHSRPSNLLIGYANGLTICLDTNSNEIKSTLSPKNSDPICFIRCSPTKPFAVLLSTQGKLTLWDLSRLSIIRQMDVPEPIINIHFLSGSYIIIIFQTLGAIVYSVSDSMKVDRRCTTPSSERKPGNWVSSCVLTESSHSSAPSLLLLSGDNGLLYLFNLADCPSSDNLCTLASIIELPPQARMAVSMTSVCLGNPATLPFIYLIVLLDTRQLIIIEGIFHDGDNDPWRWKVVSSFSNEFGSGHRGALVSASYPNDVKEMMKDDRHSCHKLSTSTYNLSAVSINDETTHYVLILDGFFYIFDWKTNATNLLSDSTKHETLLSRLPRGSRVDTVPSNPLLAPNTCEVGHHTADSSFHLGRGASVNRHFIPDDAEKDQEKSDLSPPKEEKQSFVKERNSFFQLIRSSPAFEHLTEQKLKSFLKKFEQYPARYRPLVWRYLLRLPENETSFAALCSRQGQSQYDSLKVHKKVAQRRVAQRLRNVCRLLTFWSPVFGEVDYLPQLVFPFSVVFGSDEMSCLETVMTLLMWFGHSWQATYPDPPIHITDCYDRLLEYHDCRLHKHLYTLNVSPGPLAWRILSTFFSEILPSDIWLRLMDRIFTDIQDINFVYLVPIAIIRLVRVSLLSATEKRHICGFLREPQFIGFAALTKMINEMKKSSPAYLFSWSSHSIEDLKKNLSITNPSTSELEKTYAHVSISAQEGKPIFPLPKGQYPAYDGYPAHLLDWQVQERSRVLSMKREIEIRENTLLDLENQIKEMEKEHDIIQQRTQSNQTQINFVEMMEREKQYLHELSSLEERITKQRLLNLKKVEEMSKDQLSIANRIEDDAINLLKNSELHLKERIEAAMMAEKHRELGEVADMMTRANLEKMYLKRWEEEKLAGVTAAIRLQKENIDLKNRYIFEKWKQEDDQAKLERRMRVEEAKLQMQRQIESNIEVALEENALRLYREQEAKIMEIERQRSLRLLAQHGPRSSDPADEEPILPQNHDQHSRAVSETSSESVSSVTSTISLHGLISRDQKTNNQMPDIPLPSQQQQQENLAINLDDSSLISSRDSDDLLEEAQRILDKTQAFSASDHRRKNLIKYVSQMSLSTSRSGDSLTVRSLENGSQEDENKSQNSANFALPWSKGPGHHGKIYFEQSETNEATLTSSPITASPSKTTRALEQLTHYALRGLEQSRSEITQYRGILGHVHRTDSPISLSTSASHRSTSDQST